MCRCHHGKCAALVTPTVNLTHQMVCYIEPSVVEVIGNCLRQGSQSQKKDLAGDWLNHLSISVYLHLNTGRST